MKKLIVMLVGICVVLPNVSNAEPNIQSESHNGVHYLFDVNVNQFEEPRDGQALVILHSSDFADTQRTIVSLKEEGVRPVHIIPPRVVIGFVPAEAEVRAAAIDNIVSIYRSAAPAIGLEEGSDLAIGISAWNHLVSQREAAPAGILQEEAEPLVGDALEPPMPAISQSLVGPEAQAMPGYNSTSEFMIGTVAVGVILPESDGDGENWSGARQQEVFNQIVAGLNWWAMMGGSAANLTFYYEQRFGVPTQYEPITTVGRGASSENEWVSDIFANMGYTDGPAIDRGRAYINDLRNSLGTDWSYAFIVVDSFNDADGRFESPYFAWAYLGGPYSIMTYDNDGWGIGRMNSVAAHESGHIFLAADEYCQPGYACCAFRYYGYLYVYNGNCEFDNPSSVDCIMKHNSPVICQYTNGQIGRRDTDGDGKPDTIDNVVNNTLNTYPTPTAQTILTFTGNAVDVPCYSPERYNVTINRIAAVNYRVDFGPWMDASAVDGSFDEDVEDYTFTTQALGIGQHRIDTQAYSTSGNASTVAGQYVEIVQGGFLRVTISPQGAVNAGAKWRRVGTSAWLDSGDTESGILAGLYTVEFKDIPCWSRPSNQNVTISSGQTTDTSGTYIRQAYSTIYVNINATGANNGSSWTDAYTNLRTALSVALSCDEIWVAAGTYRPTTDNNRSISFVMKQDVAVYGGFAGIETDRGQRDLAANQTILSGDIGAQGDNSDNSQHVVTGANNATLDGFTITAGNADGSDTSRIRGAGGGMYNYGSSPKVANCTFSDNTASSLGGGMFNGYYCNATVTNCIFSGNTAGEGGGMYNWNNSNPVVTNCTFSDNLSGTGGGMYNKYYSSPTVTNCILCDNIAPVGPQVYNYDNSNPNITYSNVEGGWSGQGNIDADPCFVNPTIEDYHLLPYSLCIDAGDPCLDFSLEPEPDGGRIDMGAYGNTPQATSKGGLAVESYNLASKTRVSRTLFDYEYTVTMFNNGPNSVCGVYLELLDASGNVSIIDANVSFDFIESGESATSDVNDTFRIRVDRLTPIDVTTISWRATYELCTSGTVGVQAFTNSLVLEPVVILGDFTGEGIVDFEDLAILADQWLRPPGVPYADIAPPPDGDGVVDFRDFAALANYWLD